MRGRIKEADLSVPDRWDQWLYYTRTETGAQYPIFCRRLDQPEAAEEVLLDLNQLAAVLVNAPTAKTDDLIAQNAGAYVSSRNLFLGVATGAIVLALLLLRPGNPQPERAVNTNLNIEDGAA